MRPVSLLLLALFPAAVCAAAGSPLLIDEPSQDRWMYPSNSTPGFRSQASTFSALPGSAGLDDRWGFFLFAFDTGNVLPPGLPPDAYRIRSVKITATIGQDRLFAYDPTHDSWQTYGTPSTPASIVDDDAGRPLELHGAGFRNTWTPSTFLETSPYGSSIPGTRNAFPLGFDAAGISRDVSNSVTQKFESDPWALGRTQALQAGDLVPVDTVIDFKLDMGKPGVSTYLQEGLAAGRIWFSLTSLHPATQQAGEFVAWYTKDDLYHQLFGGLAPTLEIDVELAVPLMISNLNGEVSLSWPEYAGFTHSLQACSNPTNNSWIAVHAHAATVDGIGGFSENISSAARFYRLALTRTP
jgi:hypothetical protein